MALIPTNRDMKEIKEGEGVRRLWELVKDIYC